MPPDAADITHVTLRPAAWPRRGQAYVGAFLKKPEKVIAEEAKARKEAAAAAAGGEGAAGTGSGGGGEGGSGAAAEGEAAGDAASHLYETGTFAQVRARLTWFSHLGLVCFLMRMHACVRVLHLAVLLCMLHRTSVPTHPPTRHHTPRVTPSPCHQVHTILSGDTTDSAQLLLLGHRRLRREATVRLLMGSCAPGACPLRACEPSLRLWRPLPAPAASRRPAARAGACCGQLRGGPRPAFAAGLRGRRPVLPCRATCGRRPSAPAFTPQT